MINPESQASRWSIWHDRLHKQILLNKELLPKDSTLLVCVSGGQDSMSLLQLLIDLRKFHGWELFVWHGNHSWHNKSADIAEELEQWCKKNQLTFFCDTASKNCIKNENLARNWRYKNIEKTALLLSKNSPCNITVTGHTASDKAETLILNLARGSNLKGLGSHKLTRELSTNLKLVRPLLCFTRDETTKICKELDIPIWLDPSNKDLDLKRNRIREKVMPILEEINPGCTLRMASLSQRLSNYNTDQNLIAKLAIKTISNKDGLCRLSLSSLSTSARATLIAEWIIKLGGPTTSSRQLEEISLKLGSEKGSGSKDLSNGWKIKWTTSYVKLECI
tara:strand:- start:20 stop:1024 length:1005 start_codon:yes stop_codon:yes gene_type:complete